MFFGVSCLLKLLSPLHVIMCIFNAVLAVKYCVIVSSIANNISSLDRASDVARCHVSFGLTQNTAAISTR